MKDDGPPFSMPGGAPVPAPPGSLTAQLLRGAAQDLRTIGPVKAWGWGVVGSLLWQYSPRSRPVLVEEVTQALEIAGNDIPGELDDPFHLIAMLYYPRVLRPYLDGLDHDLEAFEFDLFFAVYILASADEELRSAKDYVKEYVVDPIVEDGLLDRVRAASPTAADLFDLYSGPSVWE